jgi:hypothetical protein
MLVRAALSGCSPAERLRPLALEDRNKSHRIDCSSVIERVRVSILAAID